MTNNSIFRYTSGRMTNKLCLCIKTPLSDLLFVSLSGGKDKQLEVLVIFIMIQWEVMHILHWLTCLSVNLLAYST